MLNEYRERITQGRLEADPSQQALAERLAALSQALGRKQRRWPAILARFGLKGKGTSRLRGLYVHGPVGCGKTMLMDLFYDTTAFSPKLRAHFHEFMADVHDRIAHARKTRTADPIPRVAREIASGARLLCFDELHVTNIADAMILGRLFAQLLEFGVTVVATSNSPPAGLYKDGLNRPLFLPFISLIEEHMDVFELQTGKDYRLQKLAGRPLYFSPADAVAARALDDAFQQLTGLARGRPRQLEVKGRRLDVPESAMGVARFTFDDLCDQPLGTLDYLRLAHTFHTLIISGIPRLTPERRNAARRFIHLIDTLYDSGVCLIASAEAEPDELYPSGDNAVLFERTASRLFEMRSEAYLKARRRAEPEPAWAGSGGD